MDAARAADEGTDTPDNILRAVCVVDSSDCCCISDV